MTMRVAIVGTRYPDFSIEEEVLSPLGAEIVSGPGDDPDGLVEIASEAQVILAGSRPRFTRSVLERLDHRPAIVRSGIGVDSVDLEAAAELGYLVANVPDYGTEAVAQHTLAMVLAATRRLAEADRIVKSGAWDFADLRPLALPGSMSAGVVGFGRIGRRVAGLLLSVGFERLLAHDPISEPDGFGVEAVPFEDLLAQSDVVCMHAPGPADGRPLLGKMELAQMKPGSVLVNTSRGTLIDSEALVTSMAKDTPRVAALDVFSPEPPDLEVFAPVRDRLLLSPHMAWYSTESQAELRRRSAEEAARILEGAEPRNVIVGPKEQP